MRDFRCILRLLYPAVCEAPLRDIEFTFLKIGADISQYVKPTHGKRLFAFARIFVATDILLFRKCAVSATVYLETHFRLVGASLVGSDLSPTKKGGSRITD